MMVTLLKNGKFLNLKEENWIQGDILIKDGKIADMGNIDTCNLEINETIDVSNKLIIPGLINAHVHTYAGFLKGTIDSVPLDIYMLLAMAGGSFRSPREIYVSTMIDAIQMLKTGTTSAIDHFSQRPIQAIEGIDAAAQAFIDVGMRATIAPMYSDLSFFETVPLEIGELPQELKGKAKGPIQTPKEYAELCREAIEKWHGKDGLIRIMLGTDGPQRCSRELLDFTKGLEEQYKIGWHTHVLEAKTQAIMSHRLYGKGLIEYMDELGLINERTSLVHFIWVSEKEIDIVKDRGANVVHCPSTALHLGSGITPVDQFIQKGLNVAIGTDGGNCGNLSMFEKIRLAALLHKVGQPNYDHWITAIDALKMNLNNGARAMMQRDEIGSIQVGKEADLAILDTTSMLWQPINNITHQLVYGESGSSVEMVFVKGKKVIENGKAVFVNEEDIISEAREAVERLQWDNKEAFELARRQMPYLKKMYLRTVKEDVGFNRFTRPLL
ncbi:amidohydrolase family protein [Natronincola ferrireducens]|uniref:Cytosine/adenosine deaminase n=1 Tax=Natronincola ferrireducens TaxID=393762 RepID=A0A1G9G1T6_9FIRM|nr:amidohydrolase family protein [Natronincola ferrireducens]SDK94624.1 Cytosine/adenosine deaminase [Natronincola ferrireducens]